MPDTYAWMDPRLVARAVQGGGHGVYAACRIRRHDLLTVFGGHVMTLAREARLPLKIRDYAHQIAGDFVLGVDKVRDVGLSDYYNHSCAPNAGFKGQVFLVAMRDIKAGEQVTFDYCMVLKRTARQLPYRIACDCGAPACRGWVTGTDWKRPELQKRYKGYFQWYIEDVIENGRSSIRYPKAQDC